MSTMSNAAPPQRAILLLGPTGSGKTPLGEWLDARGLWGCNCHHFDFGSQLRALAATSASTDFRCDEIRLVQRVLTNGALLENETFHLAEKILETFIRRRGLQEGDWLILNGLPRHLGQAEAMDQIVRIRAVIQFECPGPVIRERLRLNTGGDRAARDDDQDGLVERKLALYEERTRPLVGHFRRQGAEVIALPVAVETTPAEIAGHLRRLSCLQ